MTATQFHSEGFWVLAGSIGAGIAVLTAIAVWLRVTSVRRGVTRTLHNIADRLIRDVTIPDGIGGFVAVDAILLRGRKLYVLDIRDVEGAIFGAEKMDIWTAMGRRRRYQFNNPIRPMHDRVTAVRELVPELESVPRILFTSRGHFPKGRPDGVQLLEEFAQPLLRDRKAAAAAVLDAGAEAAWLKLCEAAQVLPDKATAANKP
jgi:hypothetical protein